MSFFAFFGQQVSLVRHHFLSFCHFFVTFLGSGWKKFPQNHFLSKNRHPPPKKRKKKGLWTAILLIFGVFFGHFESNAPSKTCFFGHFLGYKWQSWAPRDHFFTVFSKTWIFRHKKEVHIPLRTKKTRFFEGSKEVRLHVKTGQFLWFFVYFFVFFREVK